MSYILDALRKSQQARQPGPAPEPRGAVHDISLSLPDISWPLVAAILLLFGMTIAGFMFWRDTADVPIVAPKPSQSIVPSASIDKPGAVVAVKTPSPEKPPARDIPVHDLAEEAQLPARAVPKKTVPAPSAGHAETAPRSAPPATPPATPAVSDDAPLLQQMPTDFQRALPPLKVSIHVYAPNPSQRILFINNRQYRQGDRVDGNIRVEEIVPDGVILSYQGQRFKLARPR